MNAPLLEPELLSRLEAAVMARQGRNEGGELRFLCPAHDDHNPSARYHPEKAVWTCDVCDTGGGALDLARRLGLELPQRESAGLTLADLAQVKGLDAAFLRGLGVADGRAGRDRQPCVDIPYCDAHGEVRAVHKRIHLTGEPRFLWRKGDKVLPYGLPRLDEARASGRILIVEGETDCWTLWQAGIPALGVPGANTWRREWAAHVEGVGHVYVWREPDAGGDSLASKAAASLPGVRIIEAAAGIKDASALWLAVGRDVETFRQRIADLMASARPASELQAEAETQVASFRAESLDAILGAQDEPLEVVIGDGEEGAVLTSDGKGCVAAPTGLGKTNLLLRLSRCLCEGVPFLGLPIPTPRRVLYVALEGSRRGYRPRLQAAATQGMEGGGR